MKNILRTMFVAAAATFAVAGCTDPTVAPKSSVSSANIFNDPGSYRAYIAKIYAGLATSGIQGPSGNPDIAGIDEGFGQYFRMLWELNELPTDEAALAWGDLGVSDLNTQQWSSNNPFTSAMYGRVYYQVMLANDFLRQTSDALLASRGTPAALAAQIKQYRAEARFLRALSYWHGIDFYGDIPLVTEADALGATPPAQAKRADVYTYVVNELNALRGDLPAVGAAQYGRVDQGSVAMLLAKLYLNAGVYTGTINATGAVTEIQKVIAGPYHLDNNFLRMFSTDNNTSPEILWAIPQNGLDIQTWGGMTFLVHASVGGSMNAANYGINGGWYGLRLKPEIVALFPGGGGPTSPDKRSSFFWYDGQSVAMGSLGDFSQGIGAPKFRNVSSTGVPGSDQNFPDTGYPMFRLGDAYLIYAEAVLRGGGGTQAQALAYVNALRDRAYGNATGEITAAQLTLPFILAERGRELLWEGQRRVDLIRFGQFSSAGIWAWKNNVKAGAVTASFHDLYPLPASELLANPKLKQNTGY
jgi:hypothetical protein